MSKMDKAAQRMHEIFCPIEECDMPWQPWLNNVSHMTDAQLDYIITYDGPHIGMDRLPERAFYDEMMKAV